MTTLAPSAAARLAIARPMPREAPVINNVLPFRVIAVSWKWLLLFYPDDGMAAIATLGLPTDPVDSLRGGDDGDALEAGDVEQIGISGDDEIGMRCERGGDDLIVIGIGGHHAWDRGGLDQFDGLGIIGQHLAGALADEGQPLRG